LVKVTRTLIVGIIGIAIVMENNCHILNTYSPLEFIWAQPNSSDLTRVVGSGDPSNSGPRISRDYPGSQAHNARWRHSGRDRVPEISGYVAQSITANSHTNRKL